MVDTQRFREWLKQNTNYADAVVSDMVSRIKRADSILEWYDEEVYQFYLERETNYKELTVSVRTEFVHES